MMTIIQKFCEAASRYPESRAVVDGSGSFTYRELDQWTNGLAHKILPLKREGDNFVVLLLPRTRLFPLAALGVLKAGATYVVLNSAYPADRINSILEVTKPVLLVTTTALWDERGHELQMEDRRVLRLDEESLDGLDRSPVDESEPDQKAYVTFTSGTTGVPKGVVQTMAGVNAQARGATGVPSAPGTRQAVVADLTFVISHFPIFESLSTGGECHMIDEELRTDLRRLTEYFNANGIEKTFVGCSMGVALLKDHDIRLKELGLGGEKLSGITPEMAAKADKVLNTYGQTELNLITLHEVTGQEDVVPVGRPSSDVKLYVLDEAMKPVPDGTVGDIYASSERMALEYLGLPEQSAERFVANPFETGTKMVRTGDRGFINPDGELMLCGRSDSMIKLRGQRIETGEVEVVAMAFKGVDAAVCVAKPVNGDDQLCLYYESAEPVDKAALRAHLAKKLAIYMIPTAFVQMDRLPRNARGKLDRKTLPDPRPEDRGLKMVPQASDNESLLFDIARKLLGTDQFGVTDDLFALGMSSLMAMRFAAEAEKVKIRMKLSDLMKYKTIRGTLQHVTRIMDWYDGYDASRETVLFVNGISLTKNIDRKLKMWAERYNVLTIEPVQEHYRHVFENDDLQEVVELYLALLDYYLPQGDRLKACTGVSWGGKLAYMIAKRWSELRGERPIVVMGDSLIECDRSMYDALLNGTFYAWLDERHLDRSGFNADFVRRQAIVAAIETRGVKIPEYDGRVILLHALDHWVLPAGNDEKWRKFASDLTVVPCDCNHNVIAMDTEKTLPIWRKVIESV